MAKRAASKAKTKAQDERFDLSAWEATTRSTADNSEGSEHGSEAVDDDAVTDEAEEDEAIDHEAMDAEAMDDEVGEDDATSRPLPVLTSKDLEAYKKKQQKRGIIYVSRIPPGMTPAKVRHIFSQFGEVGRIYLQPKDKQPQHTASKSKRSSSSHFSEGWIEFVSKRVARTTAEMLNAQPIGALGGAAHSSRRSQSGAGVINRWKDDVWTMKYLKGFRWPMLMEQMSHERASHAARLRMELSQSAHEQRDYLRKVERSKRQRRQQEAGHEAPPAPARTFQQRTPVYRDVREQRAHNQERKAGAAGDMDQVLSQIF